MPSIMSRESAKQMSRGQANELVDKLEDANLSPELAQAIISSKDNELAAKVVGFIMQSRVKVTESQKKAKEIMHWFGNYFGVLDAIKFFGVVPTPEQLEQLAEVPFSEETLDKYRNTHILAAVFPISVNDIRGILKARDLSSRCLIWGSEYHDAPAFRSKRFNEKGTVGWQLIRKYPVHNSEGKTWEQQQALLKPNEETPTMQATIYCAIAYQLLTGYSMFHEEVAVRCSDIDDRMNGSIKYREGIHQHKEPGRTKYEIHFASYREDDTRDNVGLASSIKKDK